MAIELNVIGPKWLTVQGRAMSVNQNHPLTHRVAGRVVRAAVRTRSHGHVFCNMMIQMTIFKDARPFPGAACSAVCAAPASGHAQSVHRLIHTKCGDEPGRVRRTGDSQGRGGLPAALAAGLPAAGRPRAGAGCRSARACGCRSGAASAVGVDRRARAKNHCWRPSACGRSASCWIPSRCLTPELLELLQWTASYYHHAPGEVFAAALPAALRAGQPARAHSRPG